MAPPSLNLDKPFAHEVTRAADLDGCDPFAVALDSDADEAGAAHLDPLLADDLGGGVGGGDYTVADEVAAERPARAAGRGVFGDAEAGREHAAVNGRAFVLDLAREDEDLARHAARCRALD